MKMSERTKVEINEKLEAIANTRVYNQRMVYYIPVKGNKKEKK